MKLVQRQATGTIKASANTPDLLQRVFAMRGIHCESELQCDLKRLHPVSALKEINQASMLISEAILTKKQIMIIGDFDADGATATALTYRALGMMGHSKRNYLVPNRFEFGYGLTPEIVIEAAKSKPDLIITVDNGISSVKGVKKAKALGIQVLITDHHLPGNKRPDADAIVNPNQQGDEFPSKNLAGVGVAFYLMLALKNRLQQQGYFEQQRLPPPNLAELLDLVALGTVADVVPLDQNNRILVEQGLRRIRSGQCCAGITALFQVAKRNVKRAVSTDLGFVCGPRINAAGRLDDMSLGIECLLCDDPQQALMLAGALDDLNSERRAIEQTMQDEALALLEELDKDMLSGEIPPVLCLYQEDWHQGVVGILAARIRERYHRPTIIFASADQQAGTQNHEIKGSGRSIPGLHMRDLLDEVATATPGLLDKFGGHAMAAGLSLSLSRFDEFVSAITQAVLAQADDETFDEIQHSDGELNAEDFDLKCADQLRYAAPWGQHFPAPLFDNRFVILNKRILKDKHLKLMLCPIDADKNRGRNVSAIAFNVDIQHWPEEGEQVHILYKLDVNEYQGSCSLQLMVERILPIN